MSIFDPIYIEKEADTKLKSLVLNRLDKDTFDQLSSHSPDEIWFIQDSELSGQPIVVDTRPVALPTKLSELSNDVGYCTSAYVTSRGYATESWVNNRQYATSAYVQSYVADHASKTAWRDWFQTDWPSDALTFTALSSDSQVSMSRGSSAPTVSLEYTTNGGDWNDFVVGTTTITLSNVRDKVAIRAKTTNARMASNWNNPYVNYFTGSGALKISGNINSLLNKNPEQVSTLPDFAFAGLFQNSPFRDASELTLPATSLGQYCYCRMFINSTLLKKSPELPATTLANYCYDYMFNGCTSLTTAPELPAATLSTGCYNGMFYSCTSLNSIKIAYTGNFSGTGVPSGAFSDWVTGVASTGTFYYNGSDTTRGTSAIPSNWTIQSF